MLFCKNITPLRHFNLQYLGNLSPLKGLLTRILKKSKNRTLLKQFLSLDKSVPKIGRFFKLFILGKVLQILQFIIQNPGKQFQYVKSIYQTNYM
jgi:hypothetical protein